MRAFVLKKVAFAESDWIVQFLLENGEKRSGFAAGGRASRRRFPHQFHPAGIYEIEWAQPSASSDKLVRLHRCELKTYSSELCEPLHLLTLWVMLLEWVSVDDTSTPAIFSELLQFYEQPRLERAIQFFIGQIRSHGLSPQLNECLVCSQPVTQHPRFSAQHGGLTHKTCDGDALVLTSSAWNALRNFSEGEEVLLDATLQLSDLLAFARYLQTQLGRELKSTRFMNETFGPQEIPQFSS